jgi:hypothetical protein
MMGRFDGRAYCGKRIILLEIFFVFAFLMFKQKISSFLALLGMALCIAVPAEFPKMARTYI